MSSIIEFLTEVFRFFTGILSRKREEKDDLWSQILAKRIALAKALEEGKITDAGILAEELDILMNQYGRNCKEKVGMVETSNFKATSKVVLLLALLPLVCTGCAGLFSGPGTTFVVGERINLVNPGDTVEIPKLIDPAKQWYLVDNVALQHWLKIPTALGPVETRGEVDAE